MTQLTRIGQIGRLGGGGGGAAANSDPDYFAAFAPQDSVYSYISGPHKVTYNGKTYIFFQGPKFDIYCKVYVEATGEHLGPYFVRGAGLTGDAHGIAAVLIDDQGFLHVFSGCHVTALLYTKSANAEDASAWTNQTNIATSATYPTPFQTSDNTIWLFYRAGNHIADWGYRKSTDRGATWSSFTPIISGGTTLGNIRDSWYVHIKLRNDEFHISFLWKDDTNGGGAPGWEATHRYNIYYMKLATAGTAVNISGSSVTLPVTVTYANSNLRLLDTFNDSLKHANCAVIEFDGSGNPVFLANVGSGTSHTYTTYKWNGSSLDAVGITTTDMLFDDYQLQYVSGSTWRAYLVSGGSSGLVGDDDDGTQQRDRGGNVLEFTSTDDRATWSLTNTIATAADSNSKFNSVHLGKNPTDKSRLVVPYWGGDFDLATFDRKLRLWGNTGNLRFPMEAETKALLARFTVTPSASLQSMIDAVIRNLKNAGIWSILDAYWECTQGNAADSRLNWVSTSYPMTPQGNSGAGPTFTAYSGFQGNGTDSYHDTGFIAANAAQFGRNDAHFSMYLNENTQSNNADGGWFDGVSDLILSARNTTNNLGGRINQASTSSQTSVTDSSRLTSIVRTGASAGRFYKTDVAGTTFSTASAALQASVSLTLGRLNGTSQYSTRTIGGASIGKSLTAAQIAMLWRCRYMWRRLIGQQ